MSPVPCIHCGSSATLKAGGNHSGSQRYRCLACRRCLSRNAGRLVYPCGAVSLTDASLATPVSLDLYHFVLVRVMLPPLEINYAN